jgi:predicted DNA-binding transcriptional regulator AlpA
MMPAIKARLPVLTHVNSRLIRGEHMSQEVRKLQFISPSLTPPEGSAMPATDADDQFGTRKGPTSVDPLLTAEEVALRLRVSKDWVWDHSSRKTPRLPVIRMGDGALRYKASRIEEFISERERISAVKHGRR